MRRAVEDADAFAELYRAHCVAITRYVQRRVGRTDVADDLVAETFTIALESLGAYRWRGLPFRSWLYRLASTAIHRWLRRDRYRQVDALEDDPPSAIQPPNEAAELARQVLLTLPARYQTALALHYLEGMSVEEVAAVTGVRSGTVKSQLSRGREMLRTRLRPHAAELFR